MLAVQRHGGEIGRSSAVIHSGLTSQEISASTKELRERGLLRHREFSYLLTDDGWAWLEGQREEVAEAVVAHAVVYAPCSAFSIATSGWHKATSSRKS